MPVLRTVAALIRLGRPRFLAAGVVLNGVGVASASLQGARLDVSRALLGQLLISSAQLMTSYCNDYHDLEADRANTTPTRWSGGSRVLVTGALPPATALAAAVVLAVVALVASAALAFLPGTPPGAALLGAAIVVLAWEYSAPPLRLEARGLGELDTAVVVTVMTPVLGFHLQSGVLSGASLLVVVPLALLQFAMLIAIELPDAAGDARAGKLTLVVRHGSSRMARVHGAAVLLSFVAAPALVHAGMPGAPARALLGVAPLGVWQAVAVLRWHSEARRYPDLAFGAVALVMLAAVAVLLSLVVEIAMAAC